MGNFKQLEVWQQSRSLTREIYLASARLPKDEVYGMTSQLKRASVSIASNIAEGSGRFSRQDQARLYQIALGSAHEVESLLVLAGDLGMIERSEADSLESKVVRIQRMLNGMIRSGVPTRSQQIAP
jgi:four helix bundle protein